MSGTDVFPGGWNSEASAEIWVGLGTSVCTSLTPSRFTASCNELGERGEREREREREREI